ncbi:kinase-like domain-containing protein [Sparassis latifolia]
MAPKQPCAKYQYVVTPAGPKILPVPDVHSKDEESPADYNTGGYLQVKLQDSFKNGQYVVLRKLGWGHFSTVWLVKDTQANRHSALKVVKSAGRYAETARDEIKLLGEVMEANHAHVGREHVVSFLDSFQHCGPEDTHVCIVFEPLGENLLALIERHKKTGVAPALVKVVAKQILLGLEYLHDECKLVHTDIKPENIMISIPDVESHIQAELEVIPSPTSRKVGVPPKQLGRTGVIIPRRPGGRERHVHIFDSQPLSSPSSYSPGLGSTHSVVRLNAALKKGKQKSSSSDVSDSLSGSSGSGSAFASSSFITSMSNETMATSVGSVVSGLNKISIVSSPGIYSCLCEREAGIVKGTAVVTDSLDERPQQLKPSTGPSLLSQTAPHNLTSEPVDTPMCPTCCSSLSQPPSRPASPPSNAVPSLPISVKIADLGNATPIQKHFAEDIQTRQYRAPEVILGRTDWGTTADIWSAACVIFELLTAEYLFDPQSQGDVFGKDDDHMAQIIELMGDFSPDVKFGGRFSRELFDSTGALRYIRSLKPWPLKRVMAEKYLWTEENSEAFCAFLEPMLIIDYRERMQARDLIHHPWLEVDLMSDDLCGW